MLHHKSKNIKPTIIKFPISSYIISPQRRLQIIEILTNNFHFSEECARIIEHKAYHKLLNEPIKIPRIPDSDDFLYRDFIHFFIQEPKMLSSLAVSISNESEAYINSVVDEGPGFVPDHLLIRCKKCIHSRIIITQKQSRSADEGMTYFATCTNCSSTWKT